MNKKRVPILSVVLYVLAGLLMIFAAWSAIKSFDYISLMISQGQLVFSGNEYDIISFVMSSCAQYAIFAVILLSLGRILQKCNWLFNVAIGEKTVTPEEISEDNTVVESPDDTVVVSPDDIVVESPDDTVVESPDDIVVESPDDTVV